MKHYVLGFLFNSGTTEVVLIRKERPTWQYGLLNGVGGHIEPNETPSEAMSREFEEETGLCLPESDWHLFAQMKGNNYDCGCYWAIRTDEIVAKACTMTDESVEVTNIGRINRGQCLHNLNWLLHLAIDSTRNPGLYVTADYCHKL